MKQCVIVYVGWMKDNMNPHKIGKEFQIKFLLPKGT